VRALHCAQTRLDSCMTAPYLLVPRASHLHVIYGHIVYLKEDQNRKPTTSGGLCRCTNQAATDATIRQMHCTLAGVRPIPPIFSHRRAAISNADDPLYRPRQRRSSAATTALTTPFAAFSAHRIFGLQRSHRSTQVLQIRSNMLGYDRPLQSPALAS
jgi:hypothetical protein